MGDAWSALQTGFGDVTSGIGNLFSGGQGGAAAGADSGFGPGISVGGDAPLGPGISAGAPSPAADAGGFGLTSALSQAISPPAPTIPAPQASPAASPASAATSIPNASGAIDASSVSPGFGVSTSTDPTQGTGFGVDPNAQPDTGPISGHPANQNSPIAKLLGGGQGGIANILKTALGTGVLGYDIYKGTQTPPQVKALQALEGQQAGLAKTFASEAQAENQGILPSGAEQFIDQSLNAEVAAIRSKYAQLGMSGSSAEVQDINAAKNQALALRFQIGQQLASQGLNEVNAATGEQDSLLQAILTAETQQGSALGDALAQFAGAASKGSVAA